MGQDFAVGNCDSEDDGVWEREGVGGVLVSVTSEAVVELPLATGEA